jgi:tetratricopeptide (TPR) repeat protein
VQSAAAALLKKSLERMSPEKDSYAAVKLYETGFLGAGWKLEDQASLMKLGECYAHLDLLKEAVEASETALKKSGADNAFQCHILEQGAYWQFQVGHVDRAIEWLARYLQQVPPKQVDPAHVFTLAQWKCAQKRYTEAANLYMSLLPPADQAPNKLAARASAELGRIYLETDQAANAVNFLIRAIKIYPEDKSGRKRNEFLGKCHLFLADAYFAQSSLPLAHEHYLESLKAKLNEEDAAWALYQVALLEPKLGRVDQKISSSAGLREVKSTLIWSQIGEVILRHLELREQSS